MKFTMSALFVAAAALTATPAFAQLIAYEGFEGGTVNQDVAGVGSATGFGFADLDAGTTSFRMDTEFGLSYADGAGNDLLVAGNSAGMTAIGIGGTKNLQLQLSSALPTTGTIWSSYLMQVGGPGGTSSNSWGVVSGMLTASTGPTSGLAGQESVFRSTSGNWGIFGGGNGIDERTGPSSTPDATVNFFLVNSYDLNTGTMTTYVNPSDLTDVAGTATHTISEATTSGNFTAFTHFGFSLGGGAQPTGIIDEVRVGMTLADVTPLVPVNSDPIVNQSETFSDGVIPAGYSFTLSGGHVTNDGANGDNGDGVGDGAIFVEGNDGGPPISLVSFDFSGIIVDGETYSFVAELYQASSSFAVAGVNVLVDGVVVGTVTMNAGATPALAEISYTATAADAGKTLSFTISSERTAGGGSSDTGIDNWSLAVGPTTTTILGDVDLDGGVTFLDIAPFIDRLSTGVFQAEADINLDGDVTFLDIQPFIDLLAGN